MEKDDDNNKHEMTNLKHLTDIVYSNPAGRAVFSTHMQGGVKEVRHGWYEGHHPAGQDCQPQSFPGPFIYFKWKLDNIGSVQVKSKNTVVGDTTNVDHPPKGDVVVKLMSNNGEGGSAHHGDGKHHVAHCH